MKYKLVSSIILLLSVSLNGWSQIDLTKVHFPYIYNNNWSINNPIDVEFWSPSPYSELLKNKHISAIHITPSPLNNGSSATCYFNNSGKLDSIVENAVIQNSSEKLKFKYAFVYNDLQQLAAISEFQNSVLFSFIQIRYVDNRPVSTKQVVYDINYQNKDTVFTTFLYDRSNNLIKTISFKDSMYQDTVDWKINYPLYFWNVPDQYFISNKDASLISLEKHKSFAYVFLKNSAGQTLSQSSYNFYDGDTLLEKVSSFSWNRNGILMSITTTEFESEIKTKSHYKCILNEENLPDTIFTYGDTYSFQYEYNKNIYRWSPYNFKGKRTIEDYIVDIEKFSIPQDSLTNKKVKHLWIIGDYLTKAVIESDTCWFKSDRLVLLKNQNEAFWYAGDTLIGYKKHTSPKGEIGINIVSVAAKKQEYVYGEMRKIQPAFGVRILVNNIEPKASIGEYYMSFTVVVNESEIENLRELKTNNPDYKVMGYNFMPDLKGCDFIEWHVASGQITDYEMKYLQMESLTRAYFSNIEVKNSKGEIRMMHFTLRKISD